MAIVVAALTACGGGGGSGGGGGGSKSTPTFVIGGTVTGLSGSGLELLLNNAETLAVNANGTFTFTPAVPQGGGYVVTVKTHPAGQFCTVSNGIGTISSAVTDVTVSCGIGAPSGASFSVVASVSGLNPAGSGVQLQLNGTTSLTAPSDGVYPFSTLVPSGGGYIVTVQTQPTGPAQNCVVSGGIGVIGNSNVTVNVTCNAPDTYVAGGLVLNLVGSGLTLDLNGSESLPVAADGSFTFTTALSAGGSYAVTVSTDPSIPDQTCSVTNGSGTIATANVTNVLVVCSPPASYTVGGVVTNLVGTGLQLQLNSGSTLPVSNNGAYTFTTTVQDAGSYTVSVLNNPGSPAQSCTVTNGSGTISGASVTNVSVACTPPNSYLIGGTVSGLLGGGFQLLLNGTASLNVSSDGAFQFTASPVVDAGNYAVTVQTQPAVPSQSCVVTSGTGTVSGADVSSVAVTCNPPGSFTVGGSVSGLAALGQGLQLLNGAEALDVSANGSFTFATAIVDAGTYNVTVQSQPGTPSQVCSVSSGSGTIATANVTSVSVTCAPPAQYLVGGTVLGLTGSGLKLRLNGSIDLDVTGDGPYAFGTSVVDAGAYSVAVPVQPAGPNQYCAVTGGSGTVAGANVSNADVTCSAGFSIGGTLSGLQGGNSITLRNNGGDDLTLSADGGFTFSAPVSVMQAYEVTISASPASPAQQCSVSSGMGTISIGNVTGVLVTCSSTPAHTVGGTVSGLSGSGLVLQNNAGDNLPVLANGGFTFVTPVFDGSGYAVTVSTAPSAPSQSCNVTGGSGTVSGGDVTSVGVACATNAYAIGGTLSGITGSVTLQNNGGDNLVLSGNGAFTFGTQLADLSAYSVTVPSQPAGQFCSVSNGSGTLAGSSVTTIGVVCQTLYTLGGTVTGLSGTGLVLQNNGGDDLPVSANGSFTFPTTVPNGNGYAVTVATAPTLPSQTCTVTGGGNNDGTGAVSGAAVNNIAVICITNTYTIGGTVTGLVGSDLAIRKNGTTTLLINANGPFTFPTAQADQTAYTVTVALAPNPYQACAVTNGSGTLAGANVVNVAVDCTVNPPTAATPIADQVRRPQFTGYTLDLSGTFTDLEDPPANLALSVDSVTPTGIIDAAFDPGTKNLRLTYVDSGWYNGLPVTVTVRATDSTAASVITSFQVAFVPAVYETGLNWNDYLVNDGVSVYTASGAACAGTETGGYNACIHAGEVRAIEVPGYLSCTGLTATDALDAFYWTCNGTMNPVRMESRALKPGRGLADLIDWSAAPMWLENAVTVNDGFSDVYVSPFKKWWANPFVEINAATASGALNQSGTIYAATAKPTAAVNFTLTADKVALVVKPGFALQGSGAGGTLMTATGRKFLWVEGALDANPPAGTRNSNGLAWTTTTFSVARKLKVSNGFLAAGGIAGINISGGANNRLAELTVANMNGANTVRGVWLRGATTDNTLSDVTVFNSQGAGVEVFGSSNNSLFNVTSFSNGTRGVYLVNNVAVLSSSNVLANVTVVNNAAEGVYIVGQSGTNLANGNTLMNIAASNNTYGLRMLNTNNTVIANLSSVTHSTRDVLINTSSNNAFTGVLKVTNTTGGVTGCSVTAGTSPGLTTTTCTAAGTYGSTTPGGAVLHKVITVPNTFRDAVLSDILNVSESAAGEATYALGLDWVSFENSFRGWGLNDAAAFPAAAQRGRCATGTCQVWDWSLALGDTGDRGPNGAVGGGDDVPVLLDAVAVPDGTGAVIHNWVGGGSTTFLLNAVEQRDGVAGNNDGLCESGETCLETPNIGAYQGHGLLLSSGTIGLGGTIQNVQLIQWNTNGY